ncbi:MAG TPA: PilN domain-containing protein [Gemmatimonadales bacterium]|jgi:Tfp pilus assembly protein PilN|nr:PilN domain-containing protein [Gemmatimonadales bacterium]
MITVNLKPGAKRQDQQRQPFGAGFGTALKALWARMAQPGLAIAGACWVVAAAFLAVVYFHTGSQLKTLDPQLAQARVKYNQLKTFVAEKHREEKVRDTILAQIGTIAAVDQDRYTWAHVLDEIAGALPDVTWLTEISNIPTPADAEPDSTGSVPVNVRIVGLTNDLQNYTTFLRRLEDSPWLTNVLPITAKTVIQGNRALTTFTIQATYSKADSTHVHMVPILESTVR